MSTETLSPKKTTDLPNNPVPAKAIEVKTELLKPSVGIDATCQPEPRTEYAGLRLKDLTGPAIYLVNPEGYLMLIPDPKTYNNLFRNWDGIQATDISNIAKGPALSVDAVLAKADNSDTVYIVSNGVKRGIPSPAVMDKYHFNWERIYVVPHVLIDSIPTGNVWS